MSNAEAKEGESTSFPRLSLMASKATKYAHKVDCCVCCFVLPLPDFRLSLVRVCACLCVCVCVCVCVGGGEGGFFVENSFASRILLVS